MIYIDDENLEIVMLKKYMQDKADTNQKELEKMKRSLKKAIKELSENQREVLEMYFYEGKKEIEIAEELNLYQPNVNRLKRNGINKLKTLLYN